MMGKLMGNTDIPTDVCMCGKYASWETNTTMTLVKHK